MTIPYTVAQLWARQIFGSHRQSGQSREVLALSWKAQKGLHSRFVRLAARRLMRNKILVGSICK